MSADLRLFGCVVLLAALGACSDKPLETNQLEYLQREGRAARAEARPGLATVVGWVSSLVPPLDPSQSAGQAADQVFAADNCFESGSAQHAPGSTEVLRANSCQGQMADIRISKPSAESLRLLLTELGAGQANSEPTKVARVDLTGSGFLINAEWGIEERGQDGRADSFEGTLTVDANGSGVSADGTGLLSMVTEPNLVYRVEGLHIGATGAIDSGEFIVGPRPVLVAPGEVRLFEERVSLVGFDSSAVTVSPVSDAASD